MLPSEFHFDAVDLPATNDEINRWWSRLGEQLIGFTAAGHEGPEGLSHWLAVTINHAQHAELYRLCGTMDDALPWTRLPGADVTCMTCLVRAGREGWREPS